MPFMFLLLVFRLEHQTLSWWPLKSRVSSLGFFYHLDLDQEVDDSIGSNPTEENGFSPILISNLQYLGSSSVDHYSSTMDIVLSSYYSELDFLHADPLFFTCLSHDGSIITYTYTSLEYHFSASTCRFSQDYRFTS